MADATRAADTRVGGLLLAAGVSRRTGEHNKLLYPVDGKALLRHAAEALAESRAQHKLMVTGYQARAVTTLVKDLNISIRYNPHYHRGLGASLAVGVAGLGGCDAILVCLGDMPHVGADLIDQVIDAYRATAFGRRSRGRIIVPVYRGRRGHPVLFTSEFFTALKQLDGDSGARTVLSRHADCVERLSVDSTAILRDYDTLAALERRSAHGTEN